MKKSAFLPYLFLTSSNSTINFLKNIPVKIAHITILPVLVLSIISKSEAQPGKYNEELFSIAKQVEPKVIEWRRDFHEHPELSNREFRTSEKVAEHLKSLGLEVTTGIAHTGVKAVLKGKKPGPVIALRADMDALPVIERVNIPFASKVTTTYNGAETGVMHACGHDAHTAILMGVAEVLTRMKDQLKGTVVFIFQPAEEGAPKGEEGGAGLMIKEGVLENPKVDVIFGLHMKSEIEVGKIGYKPGPMMAGASDFKIEVHGTGAHGSTPWNSVDPIVTSAQIINGIQTIVSRNVELTENPAVVTVGAIKGGNRSNIISENVEMIGTVRVFSNNDEQLVYNRLASISENIATSAGANATVQIPYSIHYPVTINSETLTAEMLPTIKQTVGEENVKLIKAITGAEDFSMYANIVPGFFFFLGGRPNTVDLANATHHHTPDFYIDESGFINGINVFVNLVFDYPELHPTASNQKIK
jgi:amidohydrolase